jgi:hypothetical protein
VAIVRAKSEGALALLGSATPSLETYHHARNGKYDLLTMSSRVENRALASVEIVDLREDFQKTHQTSPISAVLHAGIQECLANNTQALVLINRRGYSWFVLCRSNARNASHNMFIFLGKALNISRKDCERNFRERASRGSIAIPLERSGNTRKRSERLLAARWIFWSVRKCSRRDTTFSALLWSA